MHATEFRVRVSSFVERLHATGFEPTSTRFSPLAITRAWCLFEVTESLLAGNELKVAISPKDRKDFKDTLCSHFSEIVTIFSDLDANEAQVCKKDDRDFILSRIEALPEGFETVNKMVKGSEGRGRGRVCVCVCVSNVL